MNTARPLQSSSGYDPNLLFDELLRRLALDDDETLSRMLNIGLGVLLRIRRGECPLGAAMLIRISEHCGIAVTDLRRMAGDRRTEFRLEEQRASSSSLTEQGPRPRRAHTGLVRDDPGLPANVQWT